MFILELLFGIYILLYLNYYRIKFSKDNQLKNLYSTIFKLLLRATDKYEKLNLIYILLYLNYYEIQIETQHNCQHLYSTIFKLLPATTYTAPASGTEFIFYYI